MKVSVMTKGQNRYAERGAANTIRHALILYMCSEDTLLSSRVGQMYGRKQLSTTCRLKRHATADLVAQTNKEASQRRIRSLPLLFLLSIFFSATMYLYKRELQTAFTAATADISTGFNNFVNNNEGWVPPKDLLDNILEWLSGLLNATFLSEFSSTIIGCLVGVVAGAILFPLTIVLMLLAIGFTTDGIIMGSAAACWMASFGGFVPAGSFFSCVQSTGALGFRAAANIYAMIVGAVVGGCVGAYLGYMHPFF